MYLVRWWDIEFLECKVFFLLLLLFFLNLTFTLSKTYSKLLTVFFLSIKKNRKQTKSKHWHLQYSFSLYPYLVYLPSLDASQRSEWVDWPLPTVVSAPPAVSEEKQHFRFLFPWKNTLIFNHKTLSDSRTSVFCSVTFLRDIHEFRQWGKWVRKATGSWDRSIISHAILIWMP